MWICTRAFHAPKHGNARSEYEDAFFPDGVCRRDVSEFRCAVADGASESAFAGEWARLLVRGFARRRMYLRHLQRCWLRLVGRRRVPWYLEEKIRRGAHAALVGLTIRHDGGESPGGTWHVVAVGDSCLFHVRGDALLAVTPLRKSGDFGNNPRLISTDAATSFGVDASCVVMETGEWRSRDSFFLATDALAQWALRQEESGSPPWKLFRALECPDRRRRDEATPVPFEDLVSELRSKSGLRNDDTTLLRVEVA
jgi:hypothetical protein